MEVPRQNQEEPAQAAVQRILHSTNFIRNRAEMIRRGLPGLRADHTSVIIANVRASTGIFDSIVPEIRARAGKENCRTAFPPAAQSLICLLYWRQWRIFYQTHYE